MSNMLKEAIVDAKALKEIAIKNAEELIVEKFAPRINEAVQSLLEQEEEMPTFDKLPDEGGEPEKASFDKDIPLASTDGEKLCQCPEAGEEIEIDFDELEKIMSQEDELEPEEMKDKEDIAADFEQGAGEEEEEKPEEEELKQEKSPEEIANKVKATPEKDLNVALADKELSSDEKKDVLKNLRGLKEEEEINEEDVKEIEELAEKLIVDLEPVPNGYLGTIDVPDGKEWNAEIALAALKDDDKKENYEEIKKDLEDIKEQKSKLNQEMKNLLEESKKNKELIVKLGEKLETLNVANARLVYTNKILTNSSLNERQKASLVESVSKSKSMEEAKVIYETLQSAMGKKEKEPKSLNEVVSKKTVSTLIARRQEQQQESSPMKDRFQTIAGIKKK